MKIRVTLVEEMLGTGNANPEVHEEFIAKKSRDAQKVKEELEMLPAEELMDKAITVFLRGPDGRPCLMDYQFKGFLKETIGVLLEVMDNEFKMGKMKLSRYTFKRIVDKFIFVYPRVLKIEGEMGPICTRPLRAETMRGERVSLASSETIRAGAVIEVEIKTLSPVLDALVVQALDYGADSGLGQWRNSGKGRFAYEVLPE